MTTWTKHNPSGVSWSKLTSTTPSWSKNSTVSEIKSGTPIGLMLAFTYARDFVLSSFTKDTSSSVSWSKLSSSQPSWTKVTST